MIKEREGTLNSVRATAEELLKTAEPEKKQEIEEQLNDINEQWTELTGLVTKRGEQLQEVLEVSQKFNDLNKELTDQLRKTDKKAKAEVWCYSNWSILEAQSKESRLLFRLAFPKPRGYLLS